MKVRMLDEHTFNLDHFKISYDSLKVTSLLKRKAGSNCGYVTSDILICAFSIVLPLVLWQRHIVRKLAYLRELKQIIWKKDIMDYDPLCILNILFYFL